MSIEKGWEAIRRMQAVSDEEVASMTTDTKAVARLQFEAWAKGEGYPTRRGFGAADDYDFVETRRMWQAWQAAIAATGKQQVPDSVIREVFMRNGFTIKDGQSDLKNYVYAAARELLEVARQPVGQEPVFPVAVTDAMVEAYVAAVDAHLGSLTPRDWEIERFDPAASIRRVAKIGLAAMLNEVPRNGRTPLATLRFDKKAPGRENEMPHVISCNRLPDGDYEVYAAPQPDGMTEFIADLQRSRDKYPNNARMFDGLVGEVDELRRAYQGDGDLRAEAFDVAVCAFRIAVEGDLGGNEHLAARQPGAQVPVAWKYQDKAADGVWEDRISEKLPCWEHRNSIPLYAVPPAQARGLGRFRKALEAWKRDAENKRRAGEIFPEQKEAIWNEADRLLALIDQRDAAPGVE